MNEEILQALNEMARTNQKFQAHVTAELDALKANLAVLITMQKAYIVQQLGFTPEQFEEIYREQYSELSKGLATHDRQA